MFENMFEKALKIEKGRQWFFLLSRTNLRSKGVNFIFNAPNVENLGF